MTFMIVMKIPKQMVPENQQPNSNNYGKMQQI